MPLLPPRATIFVAREARGLEDTGWEDTGREDDGTARLYRHLPPVEKVAAVMRATRLSGAPDAGNVSICICHPERCEGASGPILKMLHSVQHDIVFISREKPKLTHYPDVPGFDNRAWGILRFYVWLKAALQGHRFHLSCGNGRFGLPDGLNRRVESR